MLIAIIVLVSILLIFLIHKTNKFHKEMLEKGTKREGTIIGYLDLNNNRYENDSLDRVSVEDEEIFYIKLIVSSYGEEIIIEPFGYEGEETIPLSKYFSIGTIVDFYEYKGQYRLLNDLK